MQRKSLDVWVGLFVLIGAGDTPEVKAMSDVLGDNLCGGFVGEPAKVLENLRSLEDLGISRIQVTEMVKGSTANLAEVI